MCSAVEVDHAQESTDEFWQPRLTEDMKDPGVVATRDMR